MHPIFTRGALPTAVFILCGGAAAQSAVTLKEVTITANPLGSDLAAPATQYSGEALLLRSQSTLGETLANTPGVSSTYFGPNASRPVIRGLDGDRIRILSNSGSALDVSSLSYDHAVTADPISIERIEVLRGPGALLYGGNAIGGVVNLIDNRIPAEPMQGASGKVDLGLASGNGERSAGALIEGGNQRVGLHADVFDRKARDVRVPVSLACVRAGVMSFARRICNSANEVRGGAAGASVFFDKGYLGASASTYRSDYGTVAEDEVTIGMKSDRYALEGEVRDLGGFMKSVKAHMSHTDYMHTEFEAGEAGTVFRNVGNDFRLEARHARLGALEGVLGLQAETSRFSAEGDEAFAPRSRTRQRALFAYEELGTAWGKLTFGLRTERVQVDSYGHPDVARFASGSRRFQPSSFALGALGKLNAQWQLTANLAHSERAPKDYELFANGPHLATGAWEVGDADLGKEKSLNADVGVQWKRGHHHFKVNAFNSRFGNYLALAATGQVEDGLPVFAYRQVQASLRGIEAGGNVRLLDGSRVLDLEWRGDLVRATNRSTGEPLPRIAPARAGATLAWAQGPWGVRLGFDHSARQGRVPPGDRPTEAYTLWSAAVTYRATAGAASALWYARLDNAGDRLAYSATSILTQTAPGKSPLPGRSLKAGVRIGF